MSKKWTEVKNDQVFIIRCWEERPESQVSRGEWRYRVSHINTKKNYHFSSLDEVQAFMEQKISDTRS